MRTVISVLARYPSFRGTGDRIVSFCNLVNVMPAMIECTIGTYMTILLPLDCGKWGASNLRPRHLLQVTFQKRYTIPTTSTLAHPSTALIGTTLRNHFSCYQQHACCQLIKPIIQFQRPIRYSDACVPFSLPLLRLLTADRGLETSA